MVQAFQVEDGYQCIDDDSRLAVVFSSEKVVAKGNAELWCC